MGDGKDIGTEGRTPLSHTNPASTDFSDGVMRSRLCLACALSSPAHQASAALPWHKVRAFSWNGSLRSIEHVKGLKHGPLNKGLKPAWISAEVKASLLQGQAVPSSPSSKFALKTAWGDTLETGC